MNPQRIQRKRTAGFKLPENTICVSRPSRWGNPFIAGVGGVHSRAGAVRRFERALKSDLLKDKNGQSLLSQIGELQGKSLACWCKDEPCHATVLLQIANDLQVLAEEK